MEQMGLIIFFCVIICILLDTRVVQFVIIFDNHVENNLMYQQIVNRFQNFYNLHKTTFM
jgi:hypothetical protein